MDRLKQIETFVAVATKGSLTAAAQAEGVAPAIIGRRMDALEARLGVKLLLRTTRRISLTHEGSAFLEDCQRLIADFNNAEASVSAGGVKASGHLRVTAQVQPRQLERHPQVGPKKGCRARNADFGPLARARNGKQQRGVVLIDIRRCFAQLRLFRRGHGLSFYY